MKCFSLLHLQLDCELHNVITSVMAHNESCLTSARFSMLTVSVFMYIEIKYTSAFVQISMGDFSIVVNDGKPDGRCSVGGPYGAMVQELFVDHWLSLGHKYVNTVIINYSVPYDVNDN